MRNFKFFIFLLLLINVSSASADITLKGFCVHLTSNNVKKIEGIINDKNIKSIRIDYPWSDVEKERGVLKVAEPLGSFINDMLNKNVKVLLILDYGNKVYGINKPVREEEQKKFIEYVKWVSREYASKNIMYEVYNEWWINDSDDSNSIKRSAESYARLVKYTSLAIRNNNPNAIIIASSVNPMSYKQTTWLNDFLKNNTLSYIDGISVHPYSLQGVRDNFFRIDRFESYFSKKYNNGKDIPIYITEMGFSSFNSQPLKGEALSSVMKNYISAVDKRTYIKGIWWYDLIDDGINPLSKENNFGVYSATYKLKYNDFFSYFN